MSKDLIETLYAGRSWEIEAAALIEQLKKENEELRADLKQLNEDYSGGLLVAHMNGASSMRAELEKATKQRDELLEFAEEVRRTGDTRLASMAIAVIARVKGEAK